VQADADPRFPSGFQLSPNFPNPFNSTTEIRLFAPASGVNQTVVLDICDLSGRTVRLLHHGRLSPGEHTLFWDGTDDGGLPVSSGVYFCRLISTKAVSVRKLCCLR
jgi:flagellar hook assembly protein FlgD